MIAISVPRNAPPLTTPIALPSRRGGFDVRAMSNVDIAPMTGAGTASTRTTSSQSGARPGQSSTTAQMAATTATTAIAMRLR